jgi:hypothetical protein
MEVIPWMTFLTRKLLSKRTKITALRSRISVAAAAGVRTESGIEYRNPPALRRRRVWSHTS